MEYNLDVNIDETALDVNCLEQPILDEEMRRCR